MVMKYPVWYTTGWYSEQPLEFFFSYIFIETDNTESVNVYVLINAHPCALSWFYFIVGITDNFQYGRWNDRKSPFMHTNEEIIYVIVL